MYYKIVCAKDAYAPFYVYIPSIGIDTSSIHLTDETQVESHIANDVLLGTRNRCNGSNQGLIFYFLVWN